LLEHYKAKITEENLERYRGAKRALTGRMGGDDTRIDTGKNS
jgi:hypothetical protein